MERFNRTLLDEWADDLRGRIDQHVIGKDFWTLLIAFVSKDENLNKAHVRYLESRLCQLAKEAGRAVLDNGNIPAEPKLSEPAQVLTILPLLGVDAFRLGQPKPAALIDQFSAGQVGISSIVTR